MGDVEVLTGPAALAFVESPTEESGWRTLMAHCPWATAFQHPHFARAWYRHYGRAFEPVVVVARDSVGRLVGLWCLCRDAASGQLKAVGAHQAEYQAWLCTEAAMSFPRSALQALRNQFPGYGLRFKYLAPSLPLNGLLTEPPFNALLEYQAHRRPLHDTRSATGRKSDKNQLRLLKKLGDVRFRFVDDGDDFARWLECFSTLYDIRQGAIHGAAPFHDDPAKRAVHLDWFRGGNGLALACALELNQEPIAGLFGLLTGDTLHDCVLAHSPFYAQYSPGRVLLMLLTQALPGRGVTRLDLTPGGEPWKERYANSHDEVVDLVVHPSKAAAVRARAIRLARALAKQGLVRAGLDLEAARSAIMRVARGTVLRWRRAPRERVHICDLTSWRPQLHEGRVRRDRLSDLLCHVPTGARSGRQRFFSRALRRLERGEHLYTRVENGRLLHWSWLADSTSRVAPGETPRHVDPEPGSVTVYDFHGSVDRQGWIEMVRCMLTDAERIHGARRAYVVAPTWSDSAMTALGLA